jgi:hypothetical protein
MSDGNPTPIACDGMAFTGPNGLVRLIRNHEVRTGPGDPTGRVEGPNETRYDAMGVGGTTTLDFDPRGRSLVRDFVSLNGTIVNCAGGSCSTTSAGCHARKPWLGRTRDGVRSTGTASSSHSWS